MAARTASAVSTALFTIALVLPVSSYAGGYTAHLATAPLPVPAFDELECTVSNNSSRTLTVNIKVMFHYRYAPSLPNSPDVGEDVTETLEPGQATAARYGVGSDPTIARCEITFNGSKRNVHAAGIVYNLSGAYLAAVAN